MEFDTKTSRIQLKDFQVYLDHAICNKKLLLFCGAGISIPAPSCMPSAWELLEKVRRYFTGDLDSYILKFDIRPEVLFQIISRYDTEGLQHFLDSILGAGSPNSNHVFCTSVLKAGCDVITTNFDILIETAAITANVTIALALQNESLITEAGTLYKIHGSIDAPNSMMMTINHINKGLSPTSLKNLEHLMAGRVVLVLGYSGFDQLDIMPALSGCEYEEIIWINHNPSQPQPVEATSANPWISALPRLTYIEFDTSILTKGFLPLPFNHRDKLFNLRPPNTEIRRRITLDILLHHNEFEQVERMIKSFGHDQNLTFRIAAFKAANSLGKTGRDWEAQRQQLVDEIFSLPPSEQLPFLPTVAQYCTDMKQLNELSDVITDRLSCNVATYPELGEAAIELSYSLSLKGELPLAEHQANQAIQFAKINSDIELEARALIILACIAYFRYEESPLSDILTVGIKNVDRAIFLLDHDIFNDAYFLCQAKHNKALLLRLQGEYQKALELHNDNLVWFESRDVNSTIHTHYNIAQLHFKKGDNLSAIDHLEKAKKLNARYNRKYFVEKIESLQMMISGGSDDKSGAGCK